MFKVTSWGYRNQHGQGFFPQGAFVVLIFHGRGILNPNHNQPLVDILYCNAL